MEFKLSELQQDIANLAKDFAEKKLAPTVKDRDEKEVFDRAILDEMGTLGLLGIPWEEENGGVGADFLSLAVACEEVAKVDPSIALSFEVHTCSAPGRSGNLAQLNRKLNSSNPSQKAQNSALSASPNRMLVPTL